MRRGEQKWVFRTGGWPKFILSLISILIATVIMVTRASYHTLCNPIVASHTYSLIKTHKGWSEIHGYKKVTVCGQEYFQSTRVQGDAKLTPTIEEYADSMLEKYGTGFLDFQFPDSAFYAIDFGYTTFPSKFDCSPRPLNSNVYLSTMITVDGFRVNLLNAFIDYYLEIGVEAKNILFTVQMRRV